MSTVRFHSPPARTVKRPNMRWDRQRPITRGGASDHEPPVVVVPATGATAGIPGTWTPPGSTPPATVAALQGGVPNAVVASPATGWTAGQYVQTATAGAPGQATWTGTGWVGGVAPGIFAQVADPGGFTIVEIQNWVDDNPDYADEVLAAEQARATPRTTLVDWLMGFIEHRDEP